MGTEPRTTCCPAQLWENSTVGSATPIWLGLSTGSAKRMGGRPIPHLLLPANYAFGDNVQP
jgi:hypothetical protein